MTSEFVYISTLLLTKIKQQRTCLKLRASVKARSGQIENKL